MKKYRVWRQEVVMYHNEIEAKNKTDAYEKALELDFDAWLVGECDRYDRNEGLHATKRQCD